MRKFLLTLTLLGLISGIYAQSGEENNKKQKRYTIMGLGDSITEGGGSFQCYLFPLWQKLFTAGYNFEFIGPRESACRIGSLRHSGFSGKNAEYLDSVVDSIYRKYPADIVLLHAGHNHFDTEKPVPGIIAAYESIISKIRKINPHATILMAQAITSGKLPKYAYIPVLNDSIDAMVKRLDNKQIIRVDQAKGFDWKQHTVSDKVHPNPAGAEIMAETWFKTLKKVLDKPAQSFSPRIITYKQIENEELKLHIFEPAKDENVKKRPVIVFFFGGGWTHGSPLQFYRECAYYASKGMVAVSAEYRISYLHKSTVFDSFEDAKDVIKWLRENADTYRIDPEKIVAAGASAGGHLAAATGTIQPKDNQANTYRPNLLVLYYPVIDNSEKGFGSPEVKRRYQEISPLHNIDTATPPTLFILGTKDNLVPVETAHAFEQKLTKQGIDCELHLFEGAGHPIFAYRQELNDKFYQIREITDSFLSKYGYDYLKNDL